MVSYNILVAGEAGVGKSSFINKFTDSTAQLVANNDDMWFMSTPAVKTTKTFAGATLNITEVPGSRGRMPNYHTVAREATKADCLVFCTDASSDWSARSFDRTLTLIKNSRKSNIPVVIAQLKTDLKPDAVASQEMANKHHVAFVTVNTAEGTGVDDVFTQALAAIKNTPVKIDKEAVEKEKRQKEAAEEAERKKKEAAEKKVKEQPPKEKEEYLSVWNKIVAKFVGEKPKETPAKQTEGQAEEPVVIAPSA